MLFSYLKHCRIKYIEKPHIVTNVVFICTALQNEVYRKPQDGDSSRLVSFNMSHRSAGKPSAVSDPDSDVDLMSGGRRRPRRGHRSPVNTDDVYNEIDLDDLSSAPKISADFTTDGEDSNQSADIVAETKFRLKSLEKEAQASCSCIIINPVKVLYILCFELHVHYNITSSDNLLLNVRFNERVFGCSSKSFIFNVSLFKLDVQIPGNYRNGK